MRTAVREERLLIVSDVHMGNRLFKARRPFLDFLRYACDQGYSLCINGDGIDISQLSLSRLTSDLSPCVSVFTRFATSGRGIYYTVGNHDIVLENFLHDWAGIQVVPFLTVHSGERRIRVEHGHMYDEMFLAFPRIYTGVEAIGRWALSVGPGAYHFMEKLNAALIGVGKWTTSWKKSKKEEPEDPDNVIAGERECFRTGASEVAVRGFDAVVFGHTHLPGHTILPDGTPYYNTGAWLTTPSCVAIQDGEIWFGEAADFVGGADPFRRPAAVDEAIPDITEAGHLPEPAGPMALGPARELDPPIREWRGMKA